MTSCKPTEQKKKKMSLLLAVAAVAAIGILCVASRELNCTARTDVNFLVFNRIPKCASTSVGRWLEENQPHGDYIVFNPLTLYHETDSAYVAAFQQFCHERRNVVFINHSYFFNRTVLEFLAACGKTVAFMNFARDPESRHRVRVRVLALGSCAAAREGGRV